MANGKQQYIKSLFLLNHMPATPGGLRERCVLMRELREGVCVRKNRAKWGVLRGF